MEIYCKDSAATEALGRLLGTLAQDGDVYCLTGTLGAGKTLLSRGMAAGLGADINEVNSPTFAIMNVYSGRLEMRQIEWGELFIDELPEEYLHITIELEGAGRRFVFEPHVTRYEKLCGEVEKNAGTVN